MAVSRAPCLRNRRQRTRRYESFRDDRDSALVSASDLVFNGSTSAALTCSPEEQTSRTSQSSATFSEVDVLYGRRAVLVYDPLQERYVKVSEKNRVANSTKQESVALRARRSSLARFITTKILPRLSLAFLPSGVTNDYYRFVRWRILQRFVNANLNVFGTQSLLLALRIKSSASQLGALSAALNWVLKDALGKIVRMLWASRMGRRFDSDAKRWRFRSSFVFAAGNGLEIITYVFPSLFLLWATLANCCKQISMLTSSSTRTSIYNSFRDGSRENIGDITAKGEAQIAIVDLLGIASGVTLSRTVGTSIRAVLAVYVTLQAIEIVCVYHQLRAVTYRVMNFERMISVVADFCQARQGPKDGLEGLAAACTTPTPAGIPTPQTLASQERIFLPPKHLTRRAIAFGSIGRARLAPDELGTLLEIFKRERFILVVGKNVKHPRPFMAKTAKQNEDPVSRIQENCHIVLHEAATNMDIVKSTLALTLLRRKLALSKFDPSQVRSSNCFDIMKVTQEETNDLFPLLLREMNTQGWESPARFMFGRVHMRADWPLTARSKGRTTSAT